MSRRQSVIRTVLLSLLRARVEPVQGILAASSVVHGVWIMFPQWVFELGLDSIGTWPRVLEITLGGGMVLAGLLNIVALFVGNKTLLRHSDFIEFITWVFVAMLAFLASSLTSVVWVGYLTIALVSAFIYLNTSIGADNGD